MPPRVPPCLYDMENYNFEDIGTSEWFFFIYNSLLFLPSNDTHNTVNVREDEWKATNSLGSELHCASVMKVQYKYAHSMQISLQQEKAA